VSLPEECITLTQRECSMEKIAGVESQKDKDIFSVCRVLFVWA
jgi:hypothetical protein